MLDTRIYDVIFPDGAVRQYLANSIAENMYSQVDQEGNTMALLDTIADHQRDKSAIQIADSTVKTRFTTQGWYLKVQWKDGRRQWIPLKGIKESNLITTEKYALSNDLLEEPVFRWWAAYTLKKRDHIICVIVRRKKKGLKYGIKVPETVTEELNVPISISSVPGEQPSLPMMLFILLVVNSVPSARDKWWIFILMRGLNADRIQFSIELNHLWECCSSLLRL